MKGGRRCGQRKGRPVSDTEEEGRKEICAQRLKKREGRPVSDTEEDRRKEMCPDTEKEGRRVGIRY